MCIIKSREQRMLEAAKEKIRKYLFEDVWDFDTVIDAVAEMLWEDFGVKSVVADNLAKKLVEPIWDDTVAEVQREIQETSEYYRDRESSLMDARAGRW